MRGRVLAVGYEAKGQPIVHLEVGSGADTDLVWVASLVSKPFTIGDDIVMLGLMTRSQHVPEAPELSRLVDDPFMVLGFCFVNLTQDWGAGAESYKDTCDEWFFRQMPNAPP